MNLTPRFAFAAYLALAVLSAHTAVAEVDFDEINESFDRVSSEDAAQILNQVQRLENENESELQKQTAEIFKNKGKWTFKFLLVKDDGTQIPLTEQGARDLMIPASIEKLFPGYIGYKKYPDKFTTSIVAYEDARTGNIRRMKKKMTIETVPYLSHMLHQSDCGEAETTYIKLGESNAVLSYLTQDMALTIPAGTKIIDGSGLSTSNRLSAEFMTTYLTKILTTDDSYRNFRELLAQPGQDGTLQNRLPSLTGNLFAKTGSMKNSRVASLAGFVDTKLGTLVFTVIGFGYPLATNADRITYPNCTSPVLTRRSICIARTWIDEAVKNHADWLNTLPELPDVAQPGLN